MKKIKPDIKFRAGKNMAMKVPPHQYEQTVGFYRDIVGLPQIKQEPPSAVFKFGDKQLWIDKAGHLSQSEIWLEIQCDDTEEAEKYFKSRNVVRCDEVETLPDDFEGFWITSPCDIVHLVSKS